LGKIREREEEEISDSDEAACGTKNTAVIDAGEDL
jgi:hypothetical protein